MNLMHMIAGIDTGKTSAVVCIGLDGTLLHSSHKTFAGTGWFVSTIASVGIPSVIACDREPNAIARKVCASFNARLFYPERLVTADEKHAIAKPYSITNPHEKDACSAAVKAYRFYANKLKQAEHIAGSMKVDDVDMVMAKVVSKFSINEAILNRKANRR